MAHAPLRLDPKRRKVKGAGRDELCRLLELPEDVGDVDLAMGGRIGPEPPLRLLELARARDRPVASRLVPGNRDVHESLEEVALPGWSLSPGELELLVGLEEVAPPHQLEAAHELRIAAHRPDFRRKPWYAANVATILLAGVDLFFRGKLEVLLPGHHFVTTDTAEAPELVIADISRIDPDEVAEAYPDIPIVGFTNHTDTGGLRAAHAAGFDQVVAKSALVERAPLLIEELLASVE